MRQRAGSMAADLTVWIFKQSSEGSMARASLIFQRSRSFHTNAIILALQCGNKGSTRCRAQFHQGAGGQLSEQRIVVFQGVNERIYDPRILELPRASTAP